MAQNALASFPFSYTKHQIGSERKQQKSSSSALSSCRNLSLRLRRSIHHRFRGSGWGAGDLPAEERGASGAEDTPKNSAAKRHNRMLRYLAAKRGTVTVVGATQSLPALTSSTDSPVLHDRAFQTDRSELDSIDEQLSSSGEFIAGAKGDELNDVLAIGGGSVEQLRASFRRRQFSVPSGRPFDATTSDCEQQHQSSAMLLLIFFKVENKCLKLGSFNTVQQSFVSNFSENKQY